jgi:hypothetical protein
MAFPTVERLIVAVTRYVSNFLLARVGNRLLKLRKTLCRDTPEDFAEVNVAITLLIVLDVDHDPMIFQLT